MKDVTKWSLPSLINVFQLVKIISESFKLAFNELRKNPLRSFLTLLGITIGIFCIVLIQTFVNFLNGTIDEGIKSLGENTVYVQKYPWIFANDYPWWEYQKRPSIQHENYLDIKDNLRTAESVAYFNYQFTTVKTKFEQVSNISLYGTTESADEAGGIALKYGRFFNAAEARGSRVAIIGERLSAELFGENVDPVNMDFRLNGKPFKVIGMVAEDENLISFVDWEAAVLIPHQVFSNMYPETSYLEGAQWMIIKPFDGVEYEELRDDITGSMRASRKLRPIEEEDFAINRITMIMNAVKSTKDTLSVLGYILGGFALLIGGFGVANIMFVSVRERTKYIGLKKAIGAKKWIILSEFLIEAIVLCTIGTLFSLFLVWGITKLGPNHEMITAWLPNFTIIASTLGFFILSFLFQVRKLDFSNQRKLLSKFAYALLYTGFFTVFIWSVRFLAERLAGIELNLTMSNIILGVILAFSIGIISGIVPAFIGANMNPVKAIRS